ncbi:unnamed protein product [Prorocentrum cordatum]|uniref:4-hydroxyphenylpyruvate dioxygenase n=1 Tax=Prorocentrum cordatum TaxID=2364126 RepID=A0ABN9TDM4_9DINO|nr:unnamed protein product [Polarella glacialis]
MGSEQVGSEKGGASPMRLDVEPDCPLIVSGVDRTPNSDTSISELSVFGSREGAAAVIFQACARQVWASAKLSASSARIILPSVSFDAALYADNAICISQSTSAMNQLLQTVEEESTRYGPRLDRTNREVIHAWANRREARTRLARTHCRPGRLGAGGIVPRVCAYYKGEKQVSEEDRGTLLRFVEVHGSGKLDVLPGMRPVDATFDATGVAAYCDHWVSNVVSRTGFLDTLNDTLGFTPKVDFNAGVVAAGEAQIESTVTGNDPGTLLADREMGLKDQSQVYLPINNALSEVGHVHLYLNEIGQGVQHIASRVADLPAVVQRGNDFRRMTGAGLSFLNIPRSYYGCLTAKWLAKEAGIDGPAAEACLRGLKEAGIVDAADIVDIDATRERVLVALPEGTDAAVADHVLRARYGNLHALLRENVGEDMYLKIVRNNVLVDIQGGDMLMQIFTSKILERQTGHEAPFLEFIQRVCSECTDPATCKPRKIKPGCGGFGIRNFLTLFLSIEVSKAAKAREDARAAGDAAGEARFGQVEAFTAQLDESNPVLTAISDAMTAEGEALERGDTAEVQRWAAEKLKGNDALQAISKKYKLRMKELREGVSA